MRSWMRIGLETEEALERALEGLRVGLQEAGTPDELPERFEGTLILEGVRSGDDREIAPGALRHRDLPLPLLLPNDMGGHGSDRIAGQIDSLERVETDGGAEWRMGGRFDLEGEDGREAARLVAEGFLRWVSADLDDIGEVEILEEGDCEEEDVPIILAQGDGEPCRIIQILHDGRIMGGTLVPFPAFEEARIRPEGTEEDPEGDGSMGVDDSVLERAFPVVERDGRLYTRNGDDWVEVDLEDISDQSVRRALRIEEAVGDGHTDDSEALRRAVTRAHAASEEPRPPLEHFEDPGLEELRRWVSVTEDGRVYGHLAGWGECHVGYPDRCLTPEEITEDDYDYATPGHVVTAEGERVATGPLTVRGGHAALGQGWRDAQAHYHHPENAVADVRYGSDEHGIWFSGHLRPGATPEDVYALRASGVSGDWREVGGRPRLIAACAVNAPGYPKLRARVRAGAVVAATGLGGRPRPAPIGDCDCESRVDRLERRLERLEAQDLPEIRASLLDEIRVPAGD